MSIETRHTPALWELVGEPQTEIWGLAPNKRDLLPVANAGIPCRSFEEQQANARLIAAAPELLEALQVAVERLEMNNCEQSEAAFINSAKTIITKATDLT